MKSFADKLKELRNELELTQYGLARKLGVTQACVSHWENGLQLPNLKRIHKLNDLAKKHGIRINFGE
jgi:DNA-binding XRE family transcriptional regulator